MVHGTKSFGKELFNYSSGILCTINRYSYSIGLQWKTGPWCKKFWYFCVSLGGLSGSRGTWSVFGARGGIYHPLWRPLRSSRHPYKGTSVHPQLGLLQELYFYSLLRCLHLIVTLLCYTFISRLHNVTLLHQSPFLCCFTVLYFTLLTCKSSVK